MQTVSNLSTILFSSVRKWNPKTERIKYQGKSAIGKKPQEYQIAGWGHTINDFTQ